MNSRSEDLKKLLKQRDENTRRREVIEPIDFYKGEKRDQVPVKEKKLKSYDLRKFASYVTQESYKKLKIIAVKEDKKMYDIFQDAIDTYIALKSKDG